MSVLIFMHGLRYDTGPRTPAIPGRIVRRVFTSQADIPCAKRGAVRYLAGCVTGKLYPKMRGGGGMLRTGLVGIG